MIPPDAARTAIISALPRREELHQLLRRAAGEAIALAKTIPASSSRTLTTIATAQAKAGDLDGARATFVEAAREAEGDFGGSADSWNLWRVGHFQAESGLRDEARATLQHAFKALPGVAGDFGKDKRALDTLAVLVQEQAQIGDRAGARKTADRVVEFSKQFFESSEISNLRHVAVPKVAAALAAVGDFESAFERSDGVQNRGNVLGAIAEAASQSLDRESAQKFVREAADRLAKLETVDQTYLGLGDLAEAQARLGDVETAKRSAKAIGEGPSRVAYDMTDGQPYALIRIAIIQSQRRDTPGARETLRDAFRSVVDHPKMRGRDGRYDQVACTQIANGDLDGATQTLDAMQEARTETFALIARARAAVGEDAAARTAFARAFADAGLVVAAPPQPNPELAKIPGVVQNMPMRARMKLAEIQAMAGALPAALMTLRSIDDEDVHRSALEGVVSARATSGDVAGALRLVLEESRTPEERRSALEGLGRGVDTRLSLKSLDPRAE